MELTRLPGLGPKRARMLFDELGGEAVVTGGDGRVGREDGAASRFAGRVLEGLAVIVHPLANHLQRSEGAVAFVEVVHAWVNA